MNPENKSDIYPSFSVFIKPSETGEWLLEEEANEEQSELLLELSDCWEIQYQADSL